MGETKKNRCPRSDKGDTGISTLCMPKNSTDAFPVKREEQEKQCNKFRQICFFSQWVANFSKTNFPPSGKAPLEFVLLGLLLLFVACVEGRMSFLSRGCVLWKKRVKTKEYQPPSMRKYENRTNHTQLKGGNRRKARSIPTQCLQQKQNARSPNRVLL